MIKLVEIIEQDKIPERLVHKNVFQYFNFVQGWLNSGALVGNKDLGAANFFYQFQEWLSEEVKIHSTIGWHGIFALSTTDEDAAFASFRSRLTEFKKDMWNATNIEDSVGVPGPMTEGQYFSDVISSLVEKPRLYLGKDVYLLNAFIEGWIAFRETLDENYDRLFMEQFQEWVLNRNTNASRNLRWPEIYRSVNPDPSQAMTEALKQMEYFHQESFNSSS